MNGHERLHPQEPERRVLIAGGGTGGHAIPALCVADSLSAMGAEVEFIGSEAGIESELVPAAGYTLHSLPLRGLSGGPVARARSATLFGAAIVRCRRILGAFKPSSVLGVGGYASAPAVTAASMMSIPTLIHEQNSVPGRVNRFASRLTRETLVTFPAAQGHLRNAVWVGMPTREQFFEVSQPEALERLGLEPPVVVIFGGSGGALRVNLAAAEAFGGETSYTVVQISGRRDFERLATRNPRHVILEYVHEIWDYLCAADVVVSRAGAGSLFDTAAVGRATLLIPFPYATGDHQLVNARYFLEREAAEMLPDEQVTPQSLKERVEELLADGDRRSALARNMKSLSTPEASDEVARRLLAVGKEHR